MAVIHSSPVYPADQVVVAAAGRRRRDFLINVFFRLMDGKTLCLHIDPLRDDIITIKKQLAAKQQQQQCKLQQQQQQQFVRSNNDIFLVWNGKPLDDDNTTNLRDGATVMVSTRHRGGCFMISFAIFCTIGAAIIGSTCTCGLSLCAVPFLLPLLFILPLFCL
mmetsp:Transcript_15068/g.24960  ORF Transcript_15068/g.24960 Transcript_15068/m.24960 type:complete len:163 (+) Transcript_15068:94-582(+)|eukprot:CAMPEP_0119003448 /NCGR_PEP_ID=MMETSP1176-20130426/567_1 /TAXON_ID=265551 /ORGANISM="Synedropsis recta cf, Strain CCMP1620" /LENGTH=162 /DNA_ID=CAMNT_0006955051 /DNA_START=93 /DNA_END=581 /DNA_ORIENTATION=+